MANRISEAAALQAVEIYKRCPIATSVRLEPTGHGYAIVLTPVYAGEQLPLGTPSAPQTLTDLGVELG